MCVRTNGFFILNNEAPCRAPFLTQRDLPSLIKFVLHKIEAKLAANVCTLLSEIFQADPKLLKTDSVSHAAESLLQIYTDKICTFEDKF